MKKYIILFTLALVTLSAQVQQSGGLQAHVDSLINTLTDIVGNDDYMHPITSELNTWGDIIDDIMAANYSTAHTNAQSIEYRVIEFTDTDVNPNKVYYLLQMNAGGSNYWGTIILNPSPDRAQLVIQSPHPEHDFNTGKQGYYVFRETGARAFFISSTGRCNSSSFTTCDGTTTVCGGSQSYRLSDQAHSSNGTFQRATERIINNFASSIFIQLHGFAKLSDDPSIIMSNGVQDDTPPTDYLFNLSQNLLVEDDTLDFKIAHIDTSWDRLLGTTNTQGRFINGSIDPCEEAATVNSGQFLHLEQVKIGLRENQSQWTKMSNAIAATFPVTPLPVELVNFHASLVNNNNILLDWTTATETNNYGFEVQRQISEDRGQESNWEAIGFVHGYGTTNSPKQYSFTDTLNLSAGQAGLDLNPNFTSIDYRLKQIDNDGTFEYSKVITVDLTNTTSVSDEVNYTFSLAQNYPNPFNPTTTISFSLPAVVDHQTQNVKLVVYDILGTEIATLLNQKLQPGNHKVKFNAGSFPSGVYFYKLSSNNFIITKKLMLLK